MNLYFLKNFITKLLFASGVVSGVYAMENDNLGYFSKISEEIIMEICKGVIEKSVPYKFRLTIIKPLFSPKDYGALQILVRLLIELQKIKRL